MHLNKVSVVPMLFNFEFETSAFLALTKFEFTLEIMPFLPAEFWGL